MVSKDRVRFTVVGAVNAEGPAVGTIDVWDGQTLLSYAPDGNPKYSRTDHPAQDQIPPTPIVVDPAAETFQKVCPHARRAGRSASLVGRSTVRYQCGGSPPITRNTFSTEMPARSPQQLPATRGLPAATSGRRRTGLG